MGKHPGDPWQSGAAGGNESVDYSQPLNDLHLPGKPSEGSPKVGQLDRWKIWGTHSLYHPGNTFLSFSYCYVVYESTGLNS
jgi:hypothetical protein